MAIKIMAIADVSLGFGSTQIPAFMQFMLKQYPGSSGIVVEPDQADKPYIRKRYEEFDIIRIHTHTSCYSNSSRIRYIQEASRYVEEENPDILILFCTFTLPVLFKLKKKPTFVIYYNIEMASAYSAYDQYLNRNIGENVDLFIYPEANREELDIRKFGKRKAPSVVVYNCANSDVLEHVVPIENRNGRFIYQGTLDKKNTNAGFFMGSQMEGYHIDIYGNFAGNESDSLRTGFSRLNGTVRYFGYVDNKILSEIRKNYAYGITMWTPVNENQKYAAPNKFFESIADGVIPIVAPHPQCAEIIKKYDCGILMPDWSYEGFLETIEEAAALFGTDRYRELVDNCKLAVKKELNWDIQMKKVIPYLKIL